MFHNLNFLGALLLLCWTLGMKGISVFFLFICAELYQHFALFSQMQSFAAPAFLPGDWLTEQFQICYGQFCLSNKIKTSANQRWSREGPIKGLKHEFNQRLSLGFVQQRLHRNLNGNLTAAGCCLGRIIKRSQNFAETHIKKTWGKLLQRKFWLDTRKELFSQ